MATGDSDGTKKRTPSSSISDPNNSFIKKVTSRVSGFIPTSLSKWFGPGDITPSVVRRRESEEDDDDPSIVQPPPKKRAKIPMKTETSTQSNNYSLASSTPLLHSTELWSSGPSSSGVASQATTSSTQFEMRQEIQINGDDKSDSGDSTSGYSSAPLQQNKESSVSSERVNEQPQSCSSKSGFNELHTSHSRSLFELSSNTQQKSCLSSRRPSFNASIFGSPSFIDRTLSTKRAFNSPFYVGRTMYGGASSYKKPRIFTREDTGNPLIKNPINVKPVNEPSNESASLSKVAKRILDTLEHFSSPVLDAKKIPSVNTPARENLKSQKFEKTPYKRALNRELLIPTIPDLLKMKQREKLQNSTASVRNVAVNSKSVLNTSYCLANVEEPPQQQQQSKHVNKIKSKMLFENAVEPPNLPDIQLPITTLPKFDFTLPPPPSVIHKPQKSPILKISPLKPITSSPKPNCTNVSGDFTFASPILVSSSPKKVLPVNNFEFSQPINAKCTTSITPAMNFKPTVSSSTAPRRKETSKNNGQNTVVTSAPQPAPKLLTGSVMDILKKPTTESSSLMDKFKPAEGTWECSACMVRNLPSAVRCVACETSRKTPTKKTEEIPPISFGSKFKMPTDKWECKVCMIRNSNTDAKCIACSANKPGATPAPVISTSGFGDKFKPGAGSWECSVCMIRNNSPDTKCIACESSKPGSESSKKPTLVMPPPTKTESGKSSGFADFIKKDDSKWECSSCMVRNDSTKLKCVCCETPKPGTKPTIDKPKTTSINTTFKFGIDPTKSTSDTPPKFNFGVKPTSNETTAPAPSTFKFGIPSTAVTTSPPSNFTFGLPKTTVATPSTSAFVFTPISKPTPDVTKPEDAKPKISAPIFGNVTSSSTTTMTTSTTVSSKPIFTFGVSSAPDTTKINTVSSSSGLFSNTFTAVTSAVSSTMFEVKSTNSNSNPTVTTTTNNFLANNVTNPAPALSFSDKPIPSFGTSFPVPQFNFGPGSLPFNVAKPEEKPASTNLQAPKFQLGSPVMNNAPPKPESSKPFVFGKSENPSANFGFNSNETASVNKPPVFNFGAKTEMPSTSSAAGAGVFSFGKPSAPAFGTPKLDAPVFGAPKNEDQGFSLSKTDGSAFGQPKPSVPNFGSSAATGMFGNVSQTPQNGGFNFGNNSTAPNFNFGGSTTPAPTAVFGFGTGQISSSSNSGFNMGAAAPVPSFNPDIKPNFNFTGGSVPTFSAPPQGAPTALQQQMPVRKIRKAVRRTQPR